MRIEKDIQVDAPKRKVWDFIADPANLPKFLDGITRWSGAGGPKSGLGARYDVSWKIGSIEVGGIIEVVEWDPPSGMAWNSVTGVDRRGRWRLRARDGGTRVEMRLTYRAPGGILGILADRLAEPMVKRQLGGSLRKLKTLIEALPEDG